MKTTSNKKADLLPITANKLGDNLKQLRVNSNVQVKDLARKLKMTESAYYNYESGKREPSINVLIAIVNFYHISLDDLVVTEKRKDKIPTISYLTYRINKDGDLLQSPSTKINSDNMILVYDYNNLYFFSGCDTLVPNKLMLISYKDKIYMSKVSPLEDESYIVVLKDKIVRLTKKDQKDLKFIGVLYMRNKKEANVKGLF